MLCFVNSRANVILMIVYAYDVSNMIKCVQICLDDDYLIWDEIWEWLCVLKYDIGNDDLKLFSGVWRYDYEVMFWRTLYWVEISWYVEKNVERTWWCLNKIWIACVITWTLSSDSIDALT
jgi:hypothetical protein